MTQSIMVIIYRRFGKKPIDPILKGQDGTDRLSWNVGKGLPLYAAQFPKRAQMCSSSRWKAEIVQKSSILIYVTVIY